MWSLIREALSGRGLTRSPRRSKVPLLPRWRRAAVRGNADLRFHLGYRPTVRPCGDLRKSTTTPAGTRWTVWLDPHRYRRGSIRWSRQTAPEKPTYPATAAAAVGDFSIWFLRGY